MKLYEIAAAINDVIALYEAGEISGDDLETNLDAIDLAFEEKVDACACACKNYLAEAEAIKAEESRLKERRTKAEAQAERVSAYLSANMQAAGKLKVVTARNVVSHRPSEKTVIDDIAIIPEAYIRRKPAPDPEADKTAIKAAIKAGEVIPGAHTEKCQSIQIK